ncbi:MAG: DUF397 domain-containing protein [Streptosporangiaceae bacterium]
MRDSKDRTGPVLTLTEREWASFVSSVKRGRFDL